MRWFKIGITALFVLLVIGAVIAESNPGKKLATHILLTALKKSGLHIEAGSMKGNIPYEIDMTDVKVDNMTIESLHVELSLIRLLRRELYINKLVANGVHLDSVPEGEGSTLPVMITVHSFALTNVTWKEDPAIDLYGEAKIRRDRTGFLDVDVRRKEFKNARFSASLNWGLIHDVKIDIDTPTIDALKPWIETDQRGALQLQASAKGNFDAFSGKLAGKASAMDKEWLFRGRLHKSKGGPIQIQRLLASSPGLRVQTTIELDEHYDLIQADYKIRSHLNGVVFADGTIKKGGVVHANWNSTELYYGGYTAHRITGTLDGILKDKVFIGSGTAKAECLRELWTLQSDISYRPDTAIILENLQGESGLLKAKGNISFQPGKTAVGKFEIERGDLHVLQWDLSGQATGVVSFDSEGVYGKLYGRDVYYKGAYAQKLDVERDSDNFSAKAVNATYKQLSIDTATASISTSGPWELTADGTLRDIFQIKADGFYHEKTLTVNHFYGSIVNQVAHLSRPATIELDPLKFHDVLLDYGDGVISLDYDGISGKLKLDNVPLDILSLNTLEVPVSGHINVDGQWSGKSGQAVISIPDAQIQNANVNAKLQGKFDGERIKAMGEVDVDQKPLLVFDFNVPIQPDHYAEGHLALHGKVEDVLDFFNLGTHRFEGDCDCDLKFRGRLSHPVIDGTCVIANGHYQNYLTGTELSDIRATIEGDGDHLYLRSLTAVGPDNRGSFTATGDARASLHHQFPFHLDAAFTGLNIVQIDLVSADAEGKMTIDGTLKEAFAKGNIQIVESDIAISDKIKRTFPALQVIYKHAPIPKPMPAAKLPYPLHLDLQVTAPKNIRIDGRGLHSEWSGNFYIGGTFTEPSAQGKLDLVNGEFVFAGRQFKLIDGAISMRGNTYEMPHIDIAANTNENGISITARIRGPLNKPQITFQSSPPLPLSAILSYLIFGKDLSDVSGLQALQLAATVATIAGEGPDVLERTRRALGVDRLQIVMTPSSLNEGAETISLEVGKVIFPGFLLKVSQGAEDDSPNLGIEVDITGGFTIGLESQQQPEQGKFSLNWNLNY